MFGLKTIKIRYHGSKLPIRKKGNCFDIAVDGEHRFEHGDFKLVPLNVSMTLPKWYGAHLMSRSSLSSKKQLIIGNGIGIIEADYSGIWQMPLYHYAHGITISDGEYIAQFNIYLLDEAPWWMHILNMFMKLKFKEVDVLATSRGGFGSTGGYK
jgi:dUTPase